MGIVLPFPTRRPRSGGWTAGERAALDRLTDRVAGATGWEAEVGGTRAFIIGAEDETLLIVSRGANGLAVSSGWNGAPHWRGASLERYR